MLIYPTAAILFGLVILFGVGVGPGLLFLRGRPGGHLFALAIAPALALTLFDILGFSLVMFVGPVRVWVWPVTVALLAISLGLTVWLGRRSGLWRMSAWRNHGLSRWLIGYALVLALLLSPFLALGIQYTAFRANASDAFFYMSLAETARVVDWELVQEGTEFTAANLPNLQRLAEAAPTALFTTRFIARPIPLNHLTSMAWLAQLSGAPIYQFYYAYHMLLLAAAVPAVVAIGRLLRLRRSWLALASAAVALGFWARQVVEMDASYELSTVPVLALVVFAWMLVEREPLAGPSVGPLAGPSVGPLAGPSVGPLAGPSVEPLAGPSETLCSTPSLASRVRPAILMALGLAALSMIYFPVLAVFVMALLVLGAISLFRRRFKSFVVTYAAVGALTFLVMGLVGQLSFQVRNLLVGPNVLELQRDNTPATVQTLFNDGLAALIALPVRTLYGASFPTLATAGALALQLGGVALLLVLAYWLWRGQRQGSGIRSDAARRVLAAAAAGGAIVFGVLLLDGNAKAAGKAFTYTYPYFLLLLLTAANDVAARLRSPSRRRLVSYSVAGWLVLILVAGALLPYTSSASSVFRRGRANKAAHDFDLAPIVAVLRAQSEEVGAQMGEEVGEEVGEDTSPLLLINVPRQDSWVFPYYVMQVLGGDPAQYQSGLVIDNSVDYHNLWTHRMQTAPDYVLTAIADDYLAGTGRGALLVETPDLRLYRVTDPDPAFFLAQTEAIQAADVRDRKPFPQWQPSQ